MDYFNKKCQFSLFGFNYESISLTGLISEIHDINKPCIIVTPNIDHIVRASNSKTIRDFYINADVCLNDSKVLGTLTKLFLNKSLKTVTGSDLTLGLLDRDTLKSKTIVIVGCEPEQISRLYKPNLSELNIRHINPPMKFYKDVLETNKVCDFVAKSDADLIFLAVGSPQQEMLAHQIKPMLKKGVILCIGASIDYLTGKEKRAPIWVQKIRMEWFFRFLQSPIKRFKRYFINCPQIFYLLWKERKKLKSTD